MTLPLSLPVTVAAVDTVAAPGSRLPGRGADVGAVRRILGGHGQFGHVDRPQTAVLCRTRPNYEIAQVLDVPDWVSDLAS